MSSVDSRVAGKPYKRKANGAAKDSGDGAEAVIKMETLQTRLQSLVELRIKASEAARDFTDACEAVAEASGLLPVVVKAIVRAKAGNSYVKDKAKAEQLALVFEECGEFEATVRQTELV